MSDLAEFLLARIAADEAFAAWSCWPALNDRHNAPISRERLLAECEAKRKIVEFCAKDEEAGFESIDAGVYARTVMRLLALPYADHPDYREEWLIR